MIPSNFNDELAVVQGRAEQSGEEFRCFDGALAAAAGGDDFGVERNQRRRVIGRWIGMSNAAANRAAIAYLHVANVTRSLGQQRRAIKQQAGVRDG